jgi:hypothetical protein
MIKVFTITSSTRTLIAEIRVTIKDNHFVWCETNDSTIIYYSEKLTLESYTKTASGHISFSYDFLSLLEILFKKFKGRGDILYTLTVN